MINIVLHYILSKRVAGECRPIVPILSLTRVPHLAKMDWNATMECPAKGYLTNTATWYRVRSHLATKMWRPSGIGPKKLADIECHGRGGGSLWSVV